MRVISGEFRGRRLVSPESDAIRPTSDMVKEAIFNIVQFKDISTVLDLFAGTGGLGVEAASRGAELVVLCDNNPAAIKIIRENLSFVDEKRYEIFFGDYSSCLRKYAEQQFSLILIDPPYATNHAEKALDTISSTNALARDGLIIVEHAANTAPKYPACFTQKSCRRYGSKALTILEWAEAE